MVMGLQVVCTAGRLNVKQAHLALAELPAATAGSGQAACQLHA